MENHYQCRICLEIKICLENVTTNVLEALRDIFLIVIKIPEESSFKICPPCETELLNFYKFYLRVKENQIKYESKLEESKDVPIFVKVENKFENISDEDSYAPNESPIPLDENLEQNIKVMLLKNGTDSITISKLSVQDSVKVTEINLNVETIQKTKVKKKHSRSKIRKICPICGKERDGRNLKRHLQTHARVPKKRPIKGPFTCDFCGFETRSKPYIKEHMEVRHLQIQKAVCETCGATFPRYTDLKTHMKIKHQERKRKKCNECGKYFLDLISHKNRNHRIHGTIFCKLCNKEFNNRIKLNAHIVKAHRTVECFICGNIFKKKRALTEHMHQKHIQGEPLYSCKFCDYKNNYSNNLRVHCKKFHVKEYSEIRMNQETRYDNEEIPDPHSLVFRK